MVSLVLEGGKDTIANIYYDLRENIPVVIVDVSSSSDCEKVVCVSEFGVTFCRRERVVHRI